MKNRFWIVLFAFLAVQSYAQNGNEVFSFLRYPSSTRVNALGGQNVALIERDPSLAFHNPGLLGGELDGMVNVNYMNYISDINVGSALFTKAHKERGAWAVGVTYINYGDFKEALPTSEVIGSFSANDINITGMYGYDLSDRWRGGLALKFLYSGFADFSSIGLAVDAGLSYFNDEKDFSFGLVLKNIGAQLKPYEEERQKMPWDIQLGFTKKMTHAPIRLSVTALYLNRWKFDYIDNTDKESDGDNFARTLAKHFVLGVDFVPNDNFWAGIGFNPKKNMDMKIQNGNTFGGFSAGAGVKIKKFDVGASVASYHPSAMSVMLSVTMSLSSLTE